MVTWRAFIHGNGQVFIVSVYMTPSSCYNAHKILTLLEGNNTTSPYHLQSNVSWLILTRDALVSGGTPLGDFIGYFSSHENFLRL